MRWFWDIQVAIFRGSYTYKSELQATIKDLGFVTMKVIVKTMNVDGTYPGKHVGEEKRREGTSE